MTDWTLKIIALLHDPPGKILGLAGHQRRAFELVERIIGGEAFLQRFGRAASELSGKNFEATPEGKLIKEADRIASAIDRAAFPNQTRLESPDFVRNAQIRHPFSGRSLPLALTGSSQDSVAQGILDFASGQTKPRKKYLALWRTLPLLSADPHM